MHLANQIEINSSSTGRDSFLSRPKSHVPFCTIAVQLPYNYGPFLARAENSVTLSRSVSRKFRPFIISIVPWTIVWTIVW